MHELNGTRPARLCGSPHCPRKPGAIVDSRLEFSFRS